MTYSGSVCHEGWEDDGPGSGFSWCVVMFADSGDPEGLVFSTEVNLGSAPMRGPLAETVAHCIGYGRSVLL